jgi:predicted metal-dependent hydrolase
MQERRRLIAIYKRLLGMRARRTTRRPVRGTRASGRYLAHKESARALVHAKLEHWNASYGFSYGRVAIRDQRSRWGSCSKKGNLNFNFRLVFLPERLVDAVIVHELCHLGEFNHGPKFWELVARTVPDHGERRKELARISRSGLLPR